MISNIKSFNGFFILIIALIACFIVILPHIFIPILRAQFKERLPEIAENFPNNGEYTPLIVVGAGGSHGRDEVEYACKAKQYSQRFFGGDPFIYEQKNDFYAKLVDFIPSNILGIINVITRNIKITWIISNFLFSFLWIVLLVYVFKHLGFKELTSCLISVFLLFFGLSLSNFYGFFNSPIQSLLWIINSFLTHDFYFKIPMNIRLHAPLLTYLFLFIGYIFILRLILLVENDVLNKEKRRKISKYSIILGIWIGIMIFVHFYEWSFFLASSYILLLYYLIKKRTKFFLKIFLQTLFISIFLCSPYLLSNYDRTIEFLRVLGAQFTRIPDIYSLFFIFILFLLFLSRKKSLINNVQFLFFSITQLSGLIALNIQLIMGFTTQPSHWFTIGSFFSLAFLIVLIVNYLYKYFSDKELKIISILTIVTMFIMTINNELTYSLLNYKMSALPKSYENAFDWLNKNTPKDSVVGSMSSEMINLIPAYTHNKSYIAVMAPFLSKIKEKENIQRTIELMNLLKIDPDKFYNFVAKDYNEVIEKSAQPLRKMRYNQEVEREWFESSQFCFNLVLIDYTSYEKTVKFIYENLKNNERQIEPSFKLDYLWVGKYEKKFLTNYENIEKYKIVYYNEGIDIYSINR